MELIPKTLESHRWIFDSKDSFEKVMIKVPRQSIFREKNYSDNWLKEEEYQMTKRKRG